MKYQYIPLQATIINTEHFNFTYYHSMSSTTISTSPTQLSKLQYLSIACTSCIQKGYTLPHLMRDTPNTNICCNATQSKSIDASHTRLGSITVFDTKFKKYKHIILISRCSSHRHLSDITSQHNHTNCLHKIPLSIPQIHRIRALFYKLHADVPRGCFRV